MEIEIEKTYLAKFIPNDINEFKFSSITDSYFKIMDDLNRIRIREKDEKIELTKKSLTPELNHGINKEETIILTKKELKNFYKVETEKIIKKRYYYYNENILYEIDIFEGDLDGLVMIDVEFKSREEFENFKMPKFCLCDVTNDEEIAGNKLIGKTYRKLEEFLSSKKYKKL